MSENYTFYNWSPQSNTPSTYRFYSNKTNAKEATKDYVERVQGNISPNLLKNNIYDDIEKERYSHS